MRGKDMAAKWALEEYQTHNKKFKVVYSYSDRNIFDGFMKCLKLPNKKMCEICNCKKKCFRQCVKCA